MPTLIQKHEVHYDFALIYRTTKAPEMGDVLHSGVSDDSGTTFQFEGIGCVVAVTDSWSPDRETKVYVRQFTAVHNNSLT